MSDFSFNDNYQTALKNRLGTIEQMGTNATGLMQQVAAAKNAAAQKALWDQVANSQGTPSPVSNATPATGGGTPSNYTSTYPTGTVGAFIKAISGQESGGNYKAYNKGSGATGKYQILRGNIAPWAKEVLGHAVTWDQFYNSPQLQDQIAQGMLTKYYNKYGAAGAAVAWYAGPGTAARWVQSPWASKWGASQGGYPTINSYALSVLKRMGLR
jgi:hypothetical protein